MKITVSILGWKDMCCGCGNVISSTEKVFMFSELRGLGGSIHFCEECVNVISDSKDIEVTE